MLAGNPMMESMMGKVNEVQVDKTAETRDILGHSCTKYVLSMGDSFKETLWVAPDLKMPLQYYDASKMTYAMMGPMATRFGKMLDEMKKIDGFPLATDVDMKVMGMDASSKTEVTEISEGSISGRRVRGPERLQEEEVADGGVIGPVRKLEHQARDIATRRSSDGPATTQAQAQAHQHPRAAVLDPELSAERPPGVVLPPALRAGRRARSVRPPRPARHDGAHPARHCHLQRADEGGEVDLCEFEM